MKLSELHRPTYRFHLLAFLSVIVGGVLFGLRFTRQEGPTAAVGGGCVAIAAALFGLGTQSRKEAIDTSRFYADAAVLGMKQVLDLMSEPERTRWVAAAKTVMHVVGMYKRISEPEHRSVFWMHHAALRLQIGQALGYRKREPWRYFGEAKASGPNGLFFAAQQSTPRKDQTGYEAIGAASKWIPIPGIVAIYDFVRAEDGHPDRDMAMIVERNEFAWSEMFELGRFYPGLHQYVLMSDIFHFESGMISRSRDGSEVRPDDDDFQEIAFPNGRPKFV